MDIKLWENEIPYLTPAADTPNLMKTYFLPTDKPLPCVVVFAGGAYAFRSKHEAYPVAEFYNSCGYHAVVVEYRVEPNRYPAALADAQRAIKILRYRAAEWKIDPDRILTLGFSAGGHLCASTLVCEDVSLAEHTPDDIDKMSHRPNGGILCYPVISVSSDHGHVGTGENLLGKEVYDARKEDFNLARKVCDTTPKAFLWHTSNDGSVSVKNSLCFAAALRDHNIQFEMHIYPDGPHGLGLAPDREDIRQWAPLSADWIRRNF